jgi:chromosomal replication initiation ATPase DnaA
MDKLKIKPMIADIDRHIESLKIGLTKKQKKVLSVHDKLTIIRDTVAHHYAIPATLLKSRTAKREVCEPRQVAMYISEKLTRVSLDTIGLYYDGRKHATVINSRISTANLMDTDTYKNRFINKIKDECELKLAGFSEQTETIIYLDAELTKSLTFIGISDEEIASIKNKLGI